MTVEPGVSAAAMSAFSVAITDGSSMKKSQARSPSRPRSRYTRSDATVAPSARKASRCGSSRRRPITSPPGGGMHGAAEARQQRAGDQERGADRLGQRRRPRRPGRRRRRRGHARCPRATRPRRRGAQQREHRVDVADARDVAQHDLLRGEQAGGQHRQRGVLVAGRDHGAGERIAAFDDGTCPCGRRGHVPEAPVDAVASSVRAPACADTAARWLACCAFPAAAAAEPLSFIVAPTDQIGVPGYPAATEITPEGYLYTGSGELVVPLRAAPAALERSPSGRSTAGPLPARHLARAAAGRSTTAHDVQRRGGRAARRLRPGADAQHRQPQRARAAGAIGTRYTGGEPKGSGVRRFRFAAARSRRSAPGSTTSPGYGFNAQSRALASPARRCCATGARCTSTRHDAGAASREADPRRRQRARRPACVGLTALPWTPAPGPHGACSTSSCRSCRSSGRAPPYPHDRRRALRQGPGAHARLLAPPAGPAMDLHVPERKVEDAFYASIMNAGAVALLARTATGCRPSTGSSTTRSGCATRRSSTQMFDLVGLHDIAAQDLDFFLTWQQPDGLFISRPDQYDGFGQALWAFGDHVRRTGDVAFAADAAAGGRARDGLARDAARVGPARPAAARPTPRDNELVAGHLAGDDFWAVAGLDAAADARRAAGGPDLADALARRAAAYRPRCDAQIAPGRERTGGAIPPALDASGRPATGATSGRSTPPVLRAADDTVDRDDAPRARALRRGHRDLRRRPPLHAYLGFRVFQTDLRARRAGKRGRRPLRRARPH